METFAIDKERYDRFMKKRFGIIIALAILAMAINLVLNFYAAQPGDGVVFSVTFILAMGLFVFFSIRGIRKGIKVFLSYSLTLTDSEIIRKQLNTPTVTINFMEVKEINKSKRGGFIIKGMTPPQLLFRAFLPLLGLGGLLAVDLVNDKVIAGLAGLIAMATWIWLFVFLRRSKNATVQAKRRSWIYLLFVAAIAYMWYTRFEGLPFSP